MAEEYSFFILYFLAICEHNIQYFQNWQTSSTWEVGCRKVKENNAINLLWGESLFIKVFINSFYKQMNN